MKDAIDLLLEVAAELESNLTRDAATQRVIDRVYIKHNVIIRDNDLWDARMRLGHKAPPLELPYEEPVYELCGFDDECSRSDVLRLQVQQTLHEMTEG